MGLTVQGLPPTGTPLGSNNGLPPNHPGVSLLNFLKGNIMGRPPEGKWFGGTRRSGQEEPSIYSEPEYNWELGELPNGPFKVKLNTWRGSVVDIYKNPTKEEYKKVTKRFYEEYPNAPKGEVKARSTIDEDGNYYLWMSGDATHEMMESQLKAVHGISANQNNPTKFRFK